MNCLNPFDVQSRHIMSTDGQAETLYAGCGNRGGQQYILGGRKRTDRTDETPRQSNDIKLYARSTNNTYTKGENMNEEEYEYAVRRLTPTECAALQGFPKDWCADVPHSDSAEYKLWGNGIALPSILPMMQNAVRVVEDENTKV